jgi:lipopolysaccharide export system ATP-binding protein
MARDDPRRGFARGLFGRVGAMLSGRSKTAGIAAGGIAGSTLAQEGFVALDRPYAPGPDRYEPLLDEIGQLSVYNLGKSYRSRHVVQDVSLTVRRGEAVGLLGPNGAGKTTVFYMITGLVRPDKGTIELDGHDVTGLPMYRRARLGIGYLPQEASIFRGLNVEDNIRAVLELTVPDRDAREAELDSLLDEFNIARLRKSPSVALSGGERRRCEIARALAGHPSFMLLDEPFAGIDPIAIGDIQELVLHLKSRGIGVLITDHNVRETLGLIDRAYIIHSGRVLTEGSPDEIVADPDVRRFYLGEDFRL